MGYMCHHTIVVTSPISKLIQKAHTEAHSYFGNELITELTAPATNCYQSFMIAPDGSKEGWRESDNCDKARKDYIAWLNAQAYEDGGNSLTWVEIQFGDESGDNRLLQSDRDHYDKVQGTDFETNV